MNVWAAKIAIDEQRRRLARAGQAERELDRDARLALATDSAGYGNGPHRFGRRTEQQVCPQPVNALLEQLELAVDEFAIRRPRREKPWHCGHLRDNRHPAGRFELP